VWTTELEVLFAMTQN